MKLIILLAALRIAPPVVVRTVLACCAVRCSALHAHCAISYLAAQKMSMRVGGSLCGPFADNAECQPIGAFIPQERNL